MAKWLYFSGLLGGGKVVLFHGQWSGNRWVTLGKWSGERLCSRSKFTPL